MKIKKFEEKFEPNPQIKKEVANNPLYKKMCNIAQEYYNLRDVLYEYLMDSDKIDDMDKKRDISLYNYYVECNTSNYDYPNIYITFEDDDENEYNIVLYNEDVLDFLEYYKDPKSSIYKSVDKYNI